MPYRAPTFTSKTEESIPWWQAAWFRIARQDATDRWQWARRAVGGRWVKRAKYGDLEAGLGMSRMMRVSECPSSWPTFTDDQIRRMNVFSSIEARSQNQQQEYCAGHCRCEVWP